MTDLNRNLNYDISYYECLSKQSSADSLIDFRSKYVGDYFGTKLRYSVDESFVDLIEFIKTGLVWSDVQPIVRCYDPHNATFATDKVFISLDDRADDRSYTHSDLWTKYVNRSIIIDCYGDVHILKRFVEFVRKNIVESKIPTITWEFLSDGNRQSQNIQIEPAKKIYKEFYPWIDIDVHEYFEKYLKSESSVMVLLGEPGTAKTSFIRSLIWHSTLNTTFTYEEELLKSDSFFVDFLINEDKKLLIVEDADTLLSSRESDGNKVMSKFLNVGDGLASIRGKKMIFTANITQKSKIDSALLRAGRCFDCKVFRKLTYDEAVKAAEVAGISIPQENKDYSLAELFAFANNEEPDTSTTKIGFVGPTRRHGRSVPPSVNKER